MIDNNFLNWTNKKYIKKCNWFGSWYTNIEYGSGHAHDFIGGFSRGGHLYQYNNQNDYAKYEIEKTRRANRFIKSLKSNRKILFIRRDTLASCTGSGYKPVIYKKKKELELVNTFCEYIHEKYPHLKFDVMFIKTDNYSTENMQLHSHVFCITESNLNKYFPN